MKKQIGYAWIEYTCTKCNSIHRIRYRLIQQNTFYSHGLEPQCSFYKGKKIVGEANICIHQLNKEIFVSSVSLKRIAEVLMTYAERFLTAEKTEVRFELE